MSKLERHTIVTDNAPKAIGPYSVGVRVGDFIFVSGTLGVDKDTGEMVPGGIEAQTRQVITNIKGILEAAGASLRDVVKTTVFMADLGEFSKMNNIYAEFFSVDPPARSTFGVAALPRGAAIEIEAIAVVAGNPDHA
jgi:2-iminobutanoate/2-iminopropanoate deaminase